MYVGNNERIDLEQLHSRIIRTDAERTGLDYKCVKNVNELQCEVCYIANPRCVTFTPA